MYEIWTCFDLNLKPMQCPSTVYVNQCQSTASVPSGASVPQKCAQYYSGSISSSSNGSGTATNGMALTNGMNAITTTTTSTTVRSSALKLTMSLMQYMVCAMMALNVLY